MAQPKPSSSPAVVEPIERRLMLSAAHPPAHPAAHHRAAAHHRGTAHHGGGTAVALPVAADQDNTPSVTGDTTPNGFYPNTVRQAYGLGKAGSKTVTINGGAEADGTGQTIAIIDAYANPNALADLQTFDAYMALPDPPSFQQLNQTGGTTLPTTNVGSWSVEESIDVQWAHAMAPGANIILYAADSSYNSDLNTAIATAKANNAVTVISMSYGGAETSTSASGDSRFLTPNAHTGGITYVASTGDHGATGTNATDTPAISPNVVAVGGTSLYVNSLGNKVFTYKSEAGWSGSSGGVSQYEPEPAYQLGYQNGAIDALGGGKRTAPDVSMLANPSTGVAIVDSFKYGAATPWASSVYGGTSLAAPMFGGLVAIADQARAAVGLPSLYGTRTLPRLYTLPTTDFHDVTTGSNGDFTATTGYDLVTGIGTPVANKLVFDLAGGDTVNGREFYDYNANGTYDGTDAPIAGKAVYLDLNGNAAQDATEPTATTTAAGQYTFANTATDLTGGRAVTVRLAAPPAVGFVAVPNAPAFTTGYGLTHTVDFGYFPITYATAAANAADTLRLDPSGNTVQILVGGTVAYSAPKSLVPSLTFNLTGTGSSLTVDGTNGNPVPVAGGVSFTGGTNATLAVVGTSGNDALGVSGTTVTFGATTITYAQVAAVSLNPGTGTDVLAVTGGSPVVTAPAAGAGVVARRFSSLSVSAGATLSFATAATHADRSVVVATSLSLAGSLDLGGNDLVVRNADVATVPVGFANGAWTGPGLRSSAAAADAAHTTALGVIQNADNGSALLATFDGQAVTAADVVVKYTSYGDANLDGVVTAADYTRADAGFVLGSTGWANGDVNYDGVVDGSDYALIDNAFNRQAGGL